MRIEKFELDVEYVQLCPYCKKRKIKKKTCGHPECQFKHHIKLLRERWDTHYRKTEQIRTKKHKI